MTESRAPGVRGREGVRGLRKQAPESGEVSSEAYIDTTVHPCDGESRPRRARSRRCTPVTVIRATDVRGCEGVRGLRKQAPESGEVSSEAYIDTTVHACDRESRLPTYTVATVDAGDARSIQLTRL